MLRWNPYVVSPSQVIPNTQLFLETKTAVTIMIDHINSAPLTVPPINPHLGRNLASQAGTSLRVQEVALLVPARAT